MTFVCARCRYRVLAGLAPWEDCPVCASVGYVFDKLPPYVPDYRKAWRTPRIVEYHEKVYPYKLTWTKPQVWWPMRERWEENRSSLFGIEEFRRMGEYPSEAHKLDYECFNDYTYSPELRAQMREQVALEIDSMPDDDWIGRVALGEDERYKKRKNRKDE
jgi:hypothetical protein